MKPVEMYNYFRRLHDPSSAYVSYNEFAWTGFDAIVKRHDPALLRTFFTLGQERFCLPEDHILLSVIDMKNVNHYRLCNEKTLIIDGIGYNHNKALECKKFWSNLVSPFFIK